MSNIPHPEASTVPVEEMLEGLEHFLTEEVPRELRHRTLIYLFEVTLNEEASGRETAAAILLRHESDFREAYDSSDAPHRFSWSPENEDAYLDRARDLEVERFKHLAG